LFKAPKVFSAELDGGEHLESVAGFNESGPSDVDIDRRGLNLLARRRLSSCDFALRRRLLE